MCVCVHLYVRFIECTAGDPLLTFLCSGVGVHFVTNILCSGVGVHFVTNVLCSGVGVHFITNVFCSGVGVHFTLLVVCHAHSVWHLDLGRYTDLCSPFNPNIHCRQE